ncbi:hypothetical protein FGSG_02854 [Fusarium graminearum PH-1]|uniref:Zn(2)-C6 fungal-type domain-containing protein n=1 Tax=Gibberella zeae (strain ATCC MYA-4620 / CBS 123657 / FGSC 9075 / NRRL 31084 / PH-1) TaxID=229533 RepID=I1RGI7_GIBZE|nr:hypothetical protein FGSG_02854 [Fusarium graminearum PH-1]ESU10452.1 hypothetical protein FGSG_02854 [Fusarium graminearum PH-1]EYB23534.1 hypothetical protein FG05_02854 [Fusarium graminearum]|eukprot:XP_011322951.1 hypothetical protein FGSG_02854 [Fusarium graminearum PH-1]
MVVAADDNPGKGKSKGKQYTRSRTGCLTCRQRHQKCDETRPVCGNCLLVQRQCEYPTAVLPLRERRKKFLPGEQQPWTNAVTISRAIGPGTSVATRPISMAYRSDALFHYSGLHFAWNTGQLQSFEPTFLFHKIEAMNSVNKFLRNSRMKYAVCVRNIATLCFTECAMGNIIASETHLDGLMRFMDLHRPPHKAPLAESDLDDELANRYVLFSYNFIHGFKSRVEDVLINGSVTKTSQTPSPALVEKLMHEWHKHEVQGLDIRLKSLKMIPFFFSELPPNTKFVDIDGTATAECLATLTATAQLRTQGMDFDDQQMIWQEGAATRLMLAFVGSHIESISTGGRKGSVPNGSRMASSWSGMAAATGLYLHTILRFWNAGEPIEPRLHRRVLLVLQQDLERSRRTSRPLNDLWFWKAFVGAMTVERQVASPARGVLNEMKWIYESFVREWGIMIGTTTWEQARAALSRIVWPEVFHSEGMAQELWYRCVS